MAVTVLNQWQVTQSFAPDQFATGTLSGKPVVSPTLGNWLVCLVAWKAIPGVPAVTFSVADEAHNWWVPVYSASSPPLAGAMARVAAFVAPSIRPPRFVCVSPGGAVGGFAAKVLEIGGMSTFLDPTLLSLSPLQLNSNTSLPLSLGAPSSSSLVIAAAMGDINANTGALTGTGFTALTTVTSANGVDTTGDVTLQTSWQVTSAATSATLAATAATDLGGIIFAVPVVQAAPAQPSPDRPVIILEIAPGAGVATPMEQLQWTRVPNRGLQLSITQGKQYTLDSLTAGQGTILLDNPLGDLIPPGSGSFAGIDSGTPIRLRTIWPGGDRYPPNPCPYDIPFSGFVERWPQQWDQTYRQQTPITVTDIAALNNKPMLTAVRSEITLDQPYGYWPFTDKLGSTSVSAAPPGTTAGPLTLYTSKNGMGTAVQKLGQDSGLIPGDNQTTVWQQLTVPSVQLNQGACWTTGFQPGLPSVLAGPLTVEVFMKTITAQSAVIFSFRNQAGPLIQVLIDSTGAFSLFQYVPGQPGNATITSLGAFSSTNFGLLHAALAFDATSWNWWVNGGITARASGTWTLTTPPTQVDFGGDTFSSVNFFDGELGHAAITPARLSANRLLNHYDGGATTLVNEAANGRIERLMQVAGYTGPRVVAISTELATSASDWPGQQASNAINTMAASEGGILTVASSGEPVFLARSWTWNQPAKWTLGDNVAVALNANPDFRGGSTADWTATNGTVTASQAQTYARFAWSGLLTPTGGLASAFAETVGHFPVTAGQQYLASMWCYSPTGWSAVTAGMHWYNSSGGLISTSTSDVAVPAAAWTYVSATYTAPAGAVAASLMAREDSTPAAGNTLYFVHAQPVIAAGEIPLDVDSVTDYDPTKIINDIAITQLDSKQVFVPAVGGAAIQASITQYGDQPLARTGYVQSTVTEQGQADWLFNTRSKPVTRWQLIGVECAAHPSSWPLFGRISAGDMVTVNRRPVGGVGATQGVTITGLYRVSNVRRTLQVGFNGQLVGRIELMCDTAPESAVWTMDDPVFGMLDSGNRVAY